MIHRNYGDQDLKMRIKNMKQILVVNSRILKLCNELWSQELRVTAINREYI